MGSKRRRGKKIRRKGKCENGKTKAHKRKKSEHRPQAKLFPNDPTTVQQPIFNEDL